MWTRNTMIKWGLFQECKVVILSQYQSVYSPHYKLKKKHDKIISIIAGKSIWQHLIPICDLKRKKLGKKGVEVNSLNLITCKYHHTTQWKTKYLSPNIRTKQGCCPCHANQHGTENFNQHNKERKEKTQVSERKK